MLQLTDKTIVIEQDPKDLSDELIRELEEIIPASGKPGSKAAALVTSGWVYRVPCAGVRYYSYE